MSFNYDQYDVPQADYANISAYNAQTQRAQATAQAVYNQQIAAGQSDDRALAAAKFAWQQKMDEAYQTGMWNGQYNMPTEQYFTNTFGQWYGPGGTPQTGDQTLTAQQQGFGQSNALGGLYGQYYAPGTGPQQGTATTAAGSAASSQAATRAGLTGYLQNTGTGNIVNDAWNLLDQNTQQDYINQHGGVQQAQTAYYQNLQNAVYQRAQQAGIQVTPQTMNDYVYGAWNAQGNETMQHQQQMFSQNLQTEQEARAAQAQQQSQAQSYLSLLSNLRGPADWAKYQQVLGSTPGGMRDLVAAAMGQYVPGGGATTGYNPQAASLQSMQAQVGGYDYNGQGGGQIGQPNVYQGGQGSYGYGYQPYSQQQAQQGQAQSNAQMQQQGGQPGSWYPAPYQTQAQQTWGSGIGVGGQQMSPEQAQQASGNGTNMYGANQPQYNLPAPNQIAAQSWKNMAPSQQQMLLGMYEANGWDKNDVTALQAQSMPKYANNAATAGTWRLQ